jgi:beta-lactam-binding protein with PASTA domain
MSWFKKKEMPSDTVDPVGTDAHIRPQTEEDTPPTVILSECSESKDLDTTSQDTSLSTNAPEAEAVKDPEPTPEPSPEETDDAAIEEALTALRTELSTPLPNSSDFFGDLGTGADDAIDSGEGRTPPPEAEQSHKRLYLNLIIGGLLVLLLATGGVFVYLNFGRVAVPDLVGKPSAAAVAALNEAGLKVGKLIEQEVVGVEPGTVVDQEPIVDSQVTKGSAVNLTVVSAGATAAVPNITGLSVDAAKTKLSGARLVEEEIKTFSNEVPAGSVVGFLPTAGTELVSGAVVTVLVSAGSYDTPVEIPRVLGLGQEEASKVLLEKGFNPVFYHASTSFGNLDEVVAQTPASKTSVYPGSVVMVLVSRGNSTTELTVPTLVGKTKNVATQEASTAGFGTEVFEVPDSSATTGTVVAQTPPSKDTLLRAGEAIGLLVSRGPSTDAEVPNVLSEETTVAVEALRAAGFTPVVVPVTLGTGVVAGPITQQFPAGQTPYKIGLPVLLYAPKAQ